MAKTCKLDPDYSGDAAWHFLQTRKNTPISLEDMQETIFEMGCGGVQVIFLRVPCDDLETDTLFQSIDTYEPEQALDILAGYLGKEVK